MTSKNKRFSSKKHRRVTPHLYGIMFLRSIPNIKKKIFTEITKSDAATTAKPIKKQLRNNNNSNKQINKNKTRRWQHTHIQEK